MKRLLITTALASVFWPAYAAADEARPDDEASKAPPREGDREPASAERPAARDASSPQPAEASTKQTIVLTGEDEDLTRAVAAELRAAGFTVVVIPPGGGLEVAQDEAPTVVAVRHEGDLVVVQATIVDEVLDAEVSPAGDDGMPDHDAAALRAAETIRLLVTAQSKPSEPAEAEAPAPQTEPKTERERVIHVPSVAISVEGESTADQVAPPKTVPIFRLGAHAGLAGLGYQNAWGERGVELAAVGGLTLVGDLDPEVDLRGQLTFMKTLDPDHFGDGDVWSARATLLAEWQALGSDAKFTPVLGGGLFGEVMRTEEHWGEDNHDDFDPFSGESFDPFYEYTYIQEERLMFNSGLTASAGFTAGRGMRVRVDLQGSLQLLSFGGAETFNLIPSVMLTGGFDWDVVTLRPEANRVAQR